MIPCTRESGRSCWRMASSDTKSWIIAFSAFTPRHGHDEAWEARPKNSHLTLMMPRVGRQTWVPAAAVDHHGRVHLLEHARVHETDLARAALLGGRADDVDASREGERAQRGRDGGPGAGPGGGDHVVPAGVADVRQRVVLGHDRDGGAGAGPRDGGPEGGGQPAHPALHRRAVGGQEVGEPAGGLVLLEAQLGVGVDLVADALELVGQAIDRLRDAGLGLVERGVRGGHPYRLLANSSFAALTRAGSASRSKVVRAMVFAAATMPARASGFTAASANSRVWIAMPVGAIATMGWMAGITWLTLPMSEEPRRSGMGAPSVRPAPRMLAAKRSSITRLDFIGSYTLSCWVTFKVQPVAFAAPSAAAVTRLNRSHIVSMRGARV